MILKGIVTRCYLAKRSPEEKKPSLDPRVNLKKKARGSTSRQWKTGREPNLSSPSCGKKGRRDVLREKR